MLNSVLIKLLAMIVLGEGGVCECCYKDIEWKIKSKAKLIEMLLEARLF